MPRRRPLRAADRQLDGMSQDEIVERNILRDARRAVVRLRGSDEAFEAMVVSRHAAGRGAAQSAVDAAVLEPYETGGVKVFLRMSPANIRDPEVAAAFCDVGRTAEVQVRHPRLAGMLDPLVVGIRDWLPRGRAALARLTE